MNGQRKKSPQRNREVQEATRKTWPVNDQGKPKDISKVLHLASVGI